LIARYELARLLFITDNHKARDAEAEWDNAETKHLLPYYLMAHDIIAAGYTKP